MEFSRECTPKIDIMNLNDHNTSSENASQSQLPLFLLPNSTYGQGTRLPNGFSSRDVNVTPPVNARRRMIDEEITIYRPPFKRAKSGKGDDDASHHHHHSNSSGSCLDVKSSSSSGLLADLNEPLIWQDSEPLALSRDSYSHYRRHNADVDTSQNGWMLLDAGHGRSTQRDLYLPSRANNAVQPQSYYPTADYSNVKMEARSVNPQASSYDSYVESRLHNHYRPDFVVRPWSHWSSSSWENPRSSSHQKPYPVQTNPFMNFVTREGNHAVSNGFSSGQSFESLQGPTKQECSAAVLPWLKPKHTCKSEVSNGFLDLNASTNQFMDGTDTGDGLSSVCPQKSLRPYASFSNNANTVRVEKQHKEVKPLSKRDFDINLPCDEAFCVEKEGNKTASIRHCFDLNSCASEDDEVSGPRVKIKGTFWIDLEAPPTLESDEDGERSQEKSDKGQDGNSLDVLIKVAAEAIVAISLSDHPDDAASSSTDAASKSRLSWFADIIITSCGDELERKIDAAAPEECSSGEEIDCFEAMTLSLQQTKEEDYMPELLVPENLISKETGLNRPRRGQARRGRPKRDFQRDTLPGLSSLSRQEVTEDILLFSGLMKAREHTSGASAGQNSKRSKRTVTSISQAPVCQSMNESVCGWT